MFPQTHNWLNLDETDFSPLHLAHFLLLHRYRFVSRQWYGRRDQSSESPIRRYKVMRLTVCRTRPRQSTSSVQGPSITHICSSRDSHFQLKDRRPPPARAPLLPPLPHLPIPQQRASPAKATVLSVVAQLPASRLRLLLLLRSWWRCSFSSGAIAYIGNGCRRRMDVPNGPPAGRSSTTEAKAHGRTRGANSKATGRSERRRKSLLSHLPARRRGDSRHHHPMRACHIPPPLLRRRTCRGLGTAANRSRASTEGLPSSRPILPRA